MQTLVTVLLSLTSGLVGVLLGVLLNRKYDERKGQIEILKTLIVFRYNAAALERVRAIHLIPVIFVKSKVVCGAYEAYLVAHKRAVDNLGKEDVFSRILCELDDAYIKMIEEIAKYLGLGKQITWDRLRSPYVANKYLRNGQEIWF